MSKRKTAAEKSAAVKYYILSKVLSSATDKLFNELIVEIRQTVILTVNKHVLIGFVLDVALFLNKAVSFKMLCRNR